MINTVNDNKSTYTNSAVVNTQLLDFSIYIYNIEKYLNAGRINIILNYTNISFIVLSNMRNVKKIYINDKLMMHVLENCSDTYGLFSNSNFSYYSLNVIKKIFESVSEKFVGRFNLFNVNIHYEKSIKCYEKIIYVLEYYLTNHKGSNDVNTYEYCWNIYLKAHNNFTDIFEDTSVLAETDLIDELKNLFKKLNIEKKVFSKVIKAEYLEDYDIELLKKTPYLKIIESKSEPEQSCMIM